MERANMTIPVPKAVDGDAVVVTMLRHKKPEPARVVDDPRYIVSKFGAGWTYRVRFDDGTGSLDVTDGQLEKAGA